jgi:hypothetical protein
MVKRAGVLLKHDTIEVLRERMENAATTIRNNRGIVGKSGKFISSVPSLLYRQ